jgi:Uma2 family endonuclease
MVITHTQEIPAAKRGAAPASHKSAGGLLALLPPHRFTVAQYHRMIEARVLTEYDRVQLLEGLVVPTTPHSPLHDGTVWITQTELLSVVPPGWIVRVQSAITTIDSEPEPDLTVARRVQTLYRQSHPKPRDIALIVEVAETTLQQDRTVQARVYARARIPVYWIINLVDKQVEVYTSPRGGRIPGYQEPRIYTVKESVPVVIAGKEIGQIRIRDLLP